MREQFFSFKYNEGQSVVENCLRIQQLADNLSAEGDEIKESWIMSRTLSILPPKLHHFRTGWDCTPATEKNLSSLIEKLQLEEDRLNQNNQVKENSHSALFVKQGHKNKNQKSNYNNNNNSEQTENSNECFKCGQKGHIKTNCNSKPCNKYLEYCQSKYSCNYCKEKGHFVKDCPKLKAKESQDNHKSSNKVENEYGCFSPSNPSENSRNAHLTVSLSAANIHHSKTWRNDRMWF